MTKAELKKKWGKYCDTDKLVNQLSALLTSKRIANSECGISTMLDTFFTNKEHIIEMLHNSDNYAGDLRVMVNAEINRYANNNAISSFVYGFCENVEATNAIYKYKDENGKELSDYFHIGKKVVNIKDVIDGKMNDVAFDNWHQVFDYSGVTKESARNYSNFSNAISCFSRYIGTTVNSGMAETLNAKNKEFKIAEGTKTSRAFNKVCHVYGVDSIACKGVAKIAANAKFIDGSDVPVELYTSTVKVKSIDGDNVTLTGVKKAINKKYLSNPKYNKLFAEYSDMVSGNKRKIKFFISVNPIDYITMSLGRSWSSCHGFSGGYFGGTVSYMLDSVSIITFVFDECPSDFATEGKIYRNMFHFSGNTLLQSRVYPQGNDGCTDLYAEFRAIMQKEIAQMLGAVNSWHDVEARTVAFESFGNHYKDYNYGNRHVSYIGNGIPARSMTIGHTNICPNCGREEHLYSNRITHNSCVAAIR